MPPDRAAHPLVRIVEKLDGGGRRQPGIGDGPRHSASETAGTSGAAGVLVVLQQRGGADGVIAVGAQVSAHRVGHLRPGIPADHRPYRGRGIGGEEVRRVRWQSVESGGLRAGLGLGEQAADAPVGVVDGRVGHPDRQRGPHTAACGARVSSRGRS
ncbi:hypothetical protein GCM10010341_39030 [Streptomyces noursei]|nr:hypothetical protein GCM10010341_39030 [Streptomyces noursei]